MPLAVVVAVVTIAIPTCQMVGCNMDMSNGMPFVPAGTGIFNPCAGSWVTSTGPLGVVPNAAELMLLLVAAFVAAAVISFFSQQAVRPVLAYVGNPPPPPEDPRGERIRI